MLFDVAYENPCMSEEKTNSLFNLHSSRAIGMAQPYILWPHSLNKSTKCEKECEDVRMCRKLICVDLDPFCLSHAHKTRSVCIDQRWERNVDKNSIIPCMNYCIDDDFVKSTIGCDCGLIDTCCVWINWWFYWQIVELTSSVSIVRCIYPQPLCEVKIYLLKEHF